MDNKEPSIAEPNVCYIATIQSFYPDNINTAEVLRIGQSCVVADAYAIICDRRNFKWVEAGKNKARYTVQEIRNMSVHEPLGNGARPVFETVLTQEQLDAPLGDIDTTIIYQGVWRQIHQNTPVAEALNIAEPLTRTARPTLAELNRSREAQRTASELDRYTMI